MQLDQIKATLLNILAERLSLDDGSVDSPETASLFDDDGWGIDSVDVLDLVLGIEKSFGVRIEQDEDVKRAFQSVTSLAEYIQGRLGTVAA